MEKVNAVITGIAGYVPDYILTNEEIPMMNGSCLMWVSRNAIFLRKKAWEVVI